MGYSTIIVNKSKDEMNRLLFISPDKQENNSDKTEKKPIVTDEEIEKYGLMTAKQNRLFFYLYSNKEYKMNVVRPEDLVTHIEYNRALRPGRIMYMEDSENVFVRLNNGMLKEDKLAEYDQLAREFFEAKGKQINRVKDTRPYS